MRTHLCFMRLHNIWILKGTNNDIVAHILQLALVLGLRQATQSEEKDRLMNVSNDIINCPFEHPFIVQAQGT